MRVTSDWHMFPGTTIFEASDYRITEIKVLSWPIDHVLKFITNTLTGGFETRRGTMFKSDCGIPNRMYNNHATFTTYEEAEKYLKGLQ